MTTKKKKTDSAETKKKKTKIQFNMKDILDIMKKAVSHGKGFLEAVETKLQEKIAGLVQKGEITDSEGKVVTEELRKKVKSVVEKLNENVDHAVKKSLKALNLATIEDVKSIETRLNDLLSDLEKMTASLQNAKQPIQEKVLAQPAEKKKPLVKKTVSKKAKSGKSSNQKESGQKP